MVKNPLSNAGDVGLVTGHGTKIPHATTTGCACSLSPRTEKPEEKSLHCIATGEASTLQQRPRTAQKCIKKIKDNERMNLSLVNKITMK